MNIFNKRALIFICSGFYILRAQTLESGPDMYDKMGKLWNWFNQPIEENSHQEQSESLNLAEIDFDQVFKLYSYHMKSTAINTIELTASLPPYLGVMDSRLKFELVTKPNGKQIAQYHSNFGLDSALKKIQGFKELFDSDSLTGKRLLNLMDRQNQIFLTLGLPTAFQPNEFNTNSGVLMYFHAQRLDSLKFNTFMAWIKKMSVLSWGKLIYAGPVSIKKYSDGFTIRFYISMTTPEARGHHFFIIDENYSNGKNGYGLSQTTAHLFPYVRVDNLLSLYGGFSGDSTKIIPLKIKVK